ncbi:ABC transporter substrate-binding protein [Brevibacillus sp. NRS-1366]|uniref:ABC transporter substrate-binding protein n=1 Tax=Brevibacillus sp. NRS-1366 TaxID=3233899 RepID=UPI003D1B2738
MLKKVILASIFFTLMIIAVACGSNEQNGNTGVNSEVSQLVVVGYGGQNSTAKMKSIYKPFEEKYNVKIKEVTPTNYGQFKAMVQSGNVEWDVVDVDTDFVYRGAREGLLEPLDYNVISKDGIIPQFAHEYGIGAYLYDVPIAYSTNVYSKENHPRTWSEFWDTEKFPGKRTLWKYPVALMEQALLADGVRKEELYPLDINRAFTRLDKIKKNISVWWSQGDQPVLMLTGKDAALASAWNGRVSQQKKDGAPIDLEYNQSIVLGDSWVVPKGSKNKELAMKFIAFATAAEQQANFCKLIDDSPTNTKALDLLDQSDKERLGLTDETLKTKVIVNYDWWDQNFDKVNETFEKWLIE